MEAASRADGLRSRRGLDPHDHDAREKIGRAIVSGKDGRATHLATTLDARIKGERDRAQASYVERRYDGNVPSFGERSRRSVIVRLPEGTVHYGGVPGAPGVAVPELFLGSADHVGVVGPNGSGKSTLVRALVAAVLTKPQLLVMDEPTNHLDLHSIEALERLLSEFPGAVVLVSHDARVVRSSCGRIWELLPASGDYFTSGAVVVERWEVD